MCQEYWPKLHVKHSINHRSQNGGNVIVTQMGAVRGARCSMSFRSFSVVPVHTTKRCGDLSSSGFWRWHKYKVSGILGTDSFKKS